MSNGDPVVETKNLTKIYGEFTALDNLNIHINRGQILGFIGPNGAGKTTTIKILVGLSRPSSGSATIAGADCVKNAHKIKRLVGYMPDKFGSYNNMRVVEYLDFFGAAFGIGRKKRRLRIEEVLDTTNAQWMKDRYVESLSHGMQQRIGIARTLLHDPEVLIFDEPANGLDPEARIEMRDILLNLAAMGKTLIVTSHILPELSRICNQVAIVYRGQLKAFGPLDEITRQVSQRRTVEMQLTNTEQLEATAKMIDKVEGCDDAKVSAAESIIRFKTSHGEKGLEKILSALVGKGVRISQFREIASDLEEAFLSVTREGREQAAAETSAPQPAKTETAEAAS